MKNITSILFISLLAMALPASAQLDELSNSTITISNVEAESIQPDTQWYLVYQSRGVGGYFWDTGFDLNTGSGTGDIYLSYGTDVVYDGMLAKNACMYLVRFVTPTEDQKTGDGSHDEYFLQFGTGNYVWTPTDWSETLTTVESIYDAKPLYVYWILDTPGHLGMNTADEYDLIIDNNGGGSTVVTYGTGDIVDKLDGNNDFKLYEVTLTELSDERELALLECAQVYKEYVNLTFNTEGSFDYYDAAAVAAFEAAVEAAAVIDSDNADELTVDDINQLKQNMIDAYEAVLASYVSRLATIDDGYYFFVSDMSFYEQTTTEDSEDPETGDIIPGETVTTYYTKAMYSDKESDGTIYAKWMTFEETAPFLWKIEGNGDLTYNVVNAVTGATFDNVSTSTNVTMTVGGENTMAFDQVLDDNNDVHLAIRVSTQAEDNYYYLHCGGHASGVGKSGNIVGWSNDADASHWLLQLVSDEEAAEIIDAYGSSAEKRYQDALEMISDAQEKMEIAEDMQLGDGLITSVDQLSSPYTETSEGSLDAMIDGDASTYWHSDWSDGSVEGGTHYFQVELPQVEESELVFTFTRRAVNNDHITEWGVYGASSSDADKDQCTLLATVSTPYSSNTETLMSDPFDTQGFTLLRFYCEDTTGAGDGTRGYFHLAEFQLYEAPQENPTSQKVAMGSIYTDLEAAIADAQDEGEDITEETFNALQAAYDAFIAAFVDPADLRAAIEEANATAAAIVIGTDPGEWSDTSVTSTLTSTIDEATAYDAAGVYTQAQSDTYVETLGSLTESVYASANQIETGKWYEIHYATEDAYDEYGWSKTPGSAAGSHPALFGKYICVSALEYEDEMYYTEGYTESDLDEVCVGHSLYLTDKPDIWFEDCAKFRFINVADTAYMMQNKATGLFLRAAGASGEVTLSPHPTLFNVTALGYGENLISATAIDGEDNANLHAQLSYNVLVTWATSEVGTNSGFYIEDIGEAVADDYDGTEFNMEIELGSVNAFCFPVEITANEGTMYGVQSVEGTTITLSPIEDNVAEGGHPFIFISGSTDQYDSSADAEVLTFTHGYDIEREPMTVGELVGSYYGETIGAGKALASGNGFEVTKQSSSYVDDNSAYISTEFDLEDTLTLVISDESFDSIEETVATVSQDGNIYSIDGKLLGKGNLGTVKSLGRGIYIVNGVKVVVK
ncbi:MAG: discoidin domain-containing protein [Prevotellaceae bacterium]|nr:discoidin domain-containing protein [Prevotellaceae bacterium]